MRAKKQLGQHFLHDQQVITRILDTIKDHCKEHHPIIEVGPGQGILTTNLASHYKAFKAIELDRDMVALLNQKISPDQIIHADFLKVDLNEAFASVPFNLVGNFPYNISSQIIFKMLENVAMIPVMIGMFQKEVAERICASPGSKKNGIISIRAQAMYDATMLFDINPTAFSPPPRVMSSMIMLTRKEDYSLPCDPLIFKNIIKVSFGQRRKKLRNTLKSLLIDSSDPIFQKRPEHLGVEEFINIANLIKSQNLDS